MSSPMHRRGSGSGLCRPRHGKRGEPSHDPSKVAVVVAGRPPPSYAHYHHFRYRANLTLNGGTEQLQISFTSCVTRVEFCHQYA